MFLNFIKKSIVLKSSITVLALCIMYWYTQNQYEFSNWRKYLKLTCIIFSKSKLKWTNNQFDQLLFIYCVPSLLCVLYEKVWYIKMFLYILNTLHVCNHAHKVHFILFERLRTMFRLNLCELCGYYWSHV